MLELREFEQEFIVDAATFVVKNERVEAEAYIEFLKRTDLGRQYPRENFSARIATLVQHVPVSLILRDEAGTIVGICFGLTDFAYWLFLTDLGIDKRYERKGFGKLLMRLAHDLAGGEDSIIQLLCANDAALPFYTKAGMKVATDVMVKDGIAWTVFDVNEMD